MTRAGRGSVPCRRDVLRWLTGLAGWFALPRTFAAPRAGPAAIPERPLGRTGIALPMLGLGGFHVGKAANERAARTIVETAFEEGIRLFDCAESYQKGRAERWLGAALAGVRDEVFLMTKTFDLQHRDAEGAKRHLGESLRRLRTDRLDLWQLHSVRSREDVERAFRGGGAMEFILEQKRAGVVRFTGVTGHKDPSANLRAIELWDEGWRFDVMQLPVNPVDHHQKSFERQVLPELARRGIGVLAMKTNAGGALASRRICTVEESLRYVWSLPVDAVVSGMETPEQVRHNARLARAFRPMPVSERQRLLARVEPRVELSLEWYKN